MSGPSGKPSRGPRSETREIAELRSLRERQPDLAEAIDMHLEILEQQRRVQSRIPLPWFELDAATIAGYQAEGRPILRFEAIPIDLTELRLLVRQTADIMRRHGALEAADYEQAQIIGRDMKLLELAGEWFRRTSERHLVAQAGVGRVTAQAEAASDTLDQVLTIAMRPFLSRCAEVLQRADLSAWTHGHCPLCGGEPDLAVITPAAERHLICGRCGLHWNFEPLTCPFCRNGDRSRITSFATPDGQYRVYACDACQRYVKAYDGRRAARPVLPVVDSIATLPLDAAAIQRGYSG